MYKRFLFFFDNGGGGSLCLGLPTISAPNNNFFFEIFISKNGVDAAIFLSAKIENNEWTGGNVFCSNSSALDTSIGLCKANDQYFIYMGNDFTNWENTLLSVSFVSSDNIVNPLDKGYSLEVVNNLSAFTNIIPITINESFAVSNSDRVGGYVVDDNIGGTNQTDDNALWTAWNIKKKLDEKIGALDVYTIPQVDDLLSQKANNSDVYTRTDLDIKFSEKAPVNHAINSTIYGAGTATLWGHLRLINGVTSTSTTDAGSAGSVKTAYDAAVAAQNTANGKAPIAHAVNTNTYGLGTDGVFGHLKLLAAVNSTSGVTGGIAATPSAVKTAYDLANTKLARTGDTLSGNLLYTNAGSWISCLQGNAAIRVNNAGGRAVAISQYTTNDGGSIIAAWYANALHVGYATQASIDAGTNGFTNEFVYDGATRVLSGNSIWRNTAIEIGYGGTGATNVAGARTNLGTFGAINVNGYWGIADPSGGTNIWLRTTQMGLIPYQQGGHGSLGTSSWPFNVAYINTIVGNLSGKSTSSYSSDYTDRINLPDTRSVNTSPSGYYTTWSKTLKAEFKSGLSINNPPYPGNTNFVTVVTAVPWNDSSGGWPSQLSFGNQLAYRVGVSTTSWGTWRQIMAGFQSTGNPSGGYNGDVWLKYS